MVLRRPLCRMQLNCPILRRRPKSIVRPLLILISFLVLFRLCCWRRYSIDLKVKDIQNQLLSFYSKWRNPKSLPKDDEVIVKGNAKLVVGWTPFFGGDFKSMWAKVRDDCNMADKCIFTNDRSQIANADAVIFHFKDMASKDLPNVRFEHQRYMFFLMESPYNTYDSLNGWNGFFNWTMTYRRDSDVYFPYGAFTSATSPPSDSEIKSIASKKTKLGAWFSSECVTYSRREYYMELLQKHMHLDTYGDCGALRCPKKDSRRCDKMLKDDYKFYFAFENSICNDYVTEKFLRLSHFVVPVVLRGRDYSWAPEKSFIAADNFDSTRALAAYLLHLDRNHSAYVQYLQWHKRLQVTRLDNLLNSTSAGLCTLCQKLWEDTNNKIYNDIGAWWHDAGCEKNFAWKFS